MSDFPSPSAIESIKPQVGSYPVIDSMVSAIVDCNDPIIEEGGQSDGVRLQIAFGVTEVIHRFARAHELDRIEPPLPEDLAEVLMQASDYLLTTDGLWESKVKGELKLDRAVVDGCGTIIAALAIETVTNGAKINSPEELTDDSATRNVGGSLDG